MEKEFVPYEIALELKQLGFDEPCMASKDMNNDEGLIQLPLYQQAFKFFREKYDLDSFVKHLYKSTIKVGYYFGIDQYKGVEFQMDFDAWYDTYEEAELACLKELIKIVKNK